MRRKRRHRLDFYALKPVFERPGLSSIELAEAVDLPFENFRKREKQWAQRLSNWLMRKKSTKHFQWFPRKGQTVERAKQEWHSEYPNK